MRSVDFVSHSGPAELPTGHPANEYRRSAVTTFIGSTLSTAKIRSIVENIGKNGTVAMP